MARVLFSDPDLWAGGFYELAIEVGTPSNPRMDRVLSRIWDHDTLHGCFLRTDREPKDQDTVGASLSHMAIGSTQEEEASDALYGIATMPNNECCACGTFVVREANGPDWLIFYVPMGSINAAYPESPYPFGNKSETPPKWYEPVNEWLHGLGDWTFREVDFSLALVGHEVSGELSSETVREGGVPRERWFGLLWPEQDTVSWYPPNQGPPFTY